MRTLFPSAVAGLALVAALNRPMVPSVQPTVASFWGPICWMAPYLPVCPIPVKDPPMPGPMAPESPGLDCDFVGPCQF
jgi:hypothetical protein